MYLKRIEKTNWKMQNVNPQGKDCYDCVFRAIAGGTGISWKDTFAGLCQTGLSLHAMPDYPIVFRKYLKEIGAHYVYKSAQAHAHTEDEAARHRVRAAPLRPMALRKERAPSRSFGRHRRRRGPDISF